MKIVWSHHSKIHLTEIAEYISIDKPGAARKWLQKIFRDVDRLKTFPKSGRIVPEINQENIREILFGNYRIIYKIFPEKILIISIRHGKQILDKEEIK